VTLRRWRFLNSSAPLRGKWSSRRARRAGGGFPAVQPTFDFDHLSRLAQDDPSAFEAQRQALFEAALAEMPPQHQGAARAALVQVQLRMAAARSPSERLAAAMSAMLKLQQELAAQRGEVAPAAR
jgi:hypothetical protein